MKILELPIEQMHPRIFYARKFSLDSKELVRGGRKTFLYEMGFYLGGGGTITIGENTYDIHYGDIRFVRPGTALKSKPGYHCYTITFDFGESDTVYKNHILDNMPEYVRTTGELSKFFEEIIKSFQSGEISEKLRCNALLMQLIAEVFGSYFSKKKYSDAIRDCIAYIEENYGKKITLENMGEISGYSDLHTMRLFKQETGRTPHEWLTEIRINRAKELLTDTEKNIEEIASACGFGSESHFKILFKKITGITPGVYRKNARLI